MLFTAFFFIFVCLYSKIVCGWGHEVSKDSPRCTTGQFTFCTLTNVMCCFVKCRGEIIDYTTSITAFMFVYNTKLCVFFLREGILFGDILSRSLYRNSSYDMPLSVFPSFYLEYAAGCGRRYGRSEIIRYPKMDRRWRWREWAWGYLLSGLSESNCFARIGNSLCLISEVCIPTLFLNVFYSWKVTKILNIGTLFVCMIVKS